MKNKFVALIAATFVATPVMAQNVDNQVFANQNVKAIELSQTEMKETQGEWLPIAVAAVSGAAFSGALTHAKSYYQHGKFATPKEIIPSMALGAVTGGAGKAGITALTARGVHSGLAKRAVHGVTYPTNASAQMVNTHFNGRKK